MKPIERVEPGRGLAQTPEPPYWAVIFSATRNVQPGDQFHETDQAMMKLAEQQPGYLGVETAAADIGITISYWADEESIAAWRRNADHAFAQYEGRARWYDAYELRVARVEKGAELRPGRRMTFAVPDRIDLGDDLFLRWVTVADADEIASAVDVSLAHLKPWMPWADARSADPAFQRSRLRTQEQQRERGEEWQYGLFDTAGSFLGAFGLMTRRGPRTLEIGYWLHVDAGNRGYATRAAAALTDTGLALDDLDQMIIVCDEANTGSAAIPKRLGYTLERVDTRAPEAASETGRMQIWVTNARAR